MLYKSFTLKQRNELSALLIAKIEKNVALWNNSGT